MNLRNPEDFRRAWESLDDPKEIREAFERDQEAQLTDELDQARHIIADLVEYAECNDPGCPHIAKAKGLLSGGHSNA